ncbi:hypothetical protein TNCT_571721 [Trichonephila clavata]|uniref:Uncharacterized protein n=1 Tax=Trichonephila clavata TaxID=2740835 RepID=A0A8X6FIP0_TRICU|nr:hypothetical protein TNCT_571721 [Trichonephila clavata]
MTTPGTNFLTKKNHLIPQRPSTTDLLHHTEPSSAQLKDFYSNTLSRLLLNLRTLPQHFEPSSAQARISTPSRSPSGPEH